MKIELNKHKQGKCPACGEWVDLIENEYNTWHEIRHCKRGWVLFIEAVELHNMFNPENQIKPKKKRGRKKKK
jgi:hypothetical protein